MRIEERPRPQEAGLGATLAVLRMPTVAQARDEIRRLLVERVDHTLRHTGESPSFEDYYTRSYNSSPQHGW